MIGDRVRLLSPSKRRIWQPIDRNGQTKKDAEVTYGCLTNAGWTDYDGPATTDRLGYIVPGSDPDLKHVPPSVR